jgi:hypothetical protein
MPDPLNSLPPLPIAALKRVQRLQKTTERGLRNCRYPGSRTLDLRKAIEILRTSVVEELNIRLGYFETVSGFDWSWMKEITTHATASALACFPQSQFEKRDENNVLIGYEDDSQFIDELVTTSWDHVVSRRLASNPIPIPAVTIAQPENRKELVVAYRAAFPEAGIMDICWAAKQHYREWSRWLKDQLKDDSRPDRAFRRVLSSGKRPQEMRREPRPKGWK